MEKKPLSENLSCRPNQKGNLFPRQFKCFLKSHFLGINSHLQSCHDWGKRIEKRLLYYTIVNCIKSSFCLLLKRFPLNASALKCEIEDWDSFLMEIEIEIYLFCETFFLLNSFVLCTLRYFFVENKFVSVDPFKTILGGKNRFLW